MGTSINVSGSRVTLVLPGWMHRFRVVQRWKNEQEFEKVGRYKVWNERDNRCILIASIPRVSRLNNRIVG